MVTDPIADLLTRVRNAAMARHDSVVIPASKMKILVAKILKDEGFIVAKIYRQTACFHRT
jgi:small subunit ribosomal protein S8